MFKHLNSFRVRLLLILALLLIATLGVQYLINVYLAQRAARLIGEQEQALAVGVALALESLPSTDRLNEIYKERQPAVVQQQAGRLLNVLSVFPDGNIDDSLDTRYLPTMRDDGSTGYFNISEVNLPPLVDAGIATREIAQTLNLPVTASPQIGAPRAFAGRTETTKGATYIIVVLSSAAAGDDTPLRPAAALLPTLLVLIVATFATGFLVWHFTQPIANLAEAARRTGEGDFSYRIPAATRKDEMGQLALAFNRMNEQVGHLRELEVQVQQAERSAVVGRLASAIAHEIRNPLNYINLTLDHLRTSFAPEDAAKRTTFMRLAENLKTEVARINTRVSEFLKYSRPSRLNLQLLDLRAEVEDALRLVEPQAAASNIQTVIETHNAQLFINGDAEALRSVFTNLMINAVHAMEEQNAGRLTVVLSRAGSFARVSITDTGAGIASEHLPQIFEPYFSTKETGTGLGLAIVKKAIEDHNGRIHVESALRVGTTFTIDLPVTPESRA